MKSKYKFLFIELLNDYKKIFNLSEKSKIFKKRLLLLEEWFFSLDYYLYKEGIKKLYLIDNNEDTLPRRILDFYTIKDLNHKIIKKKYKYKNIYLKKILFYFFSLIKIRKLSFSRSNILLTKIRDRISHLYLMYYIVPKKLKTDEDLKKNFKKKILEKNCNILLKKFLIKNFLDLFFINSKNNEVTEIYIYPHSILYENIFFKLFLTFNNFKIIGYQHGAGYGQFPKDRLYTIEKGISDKFIDWFPINKSKYIGRFEKINLKPSSISKIYWLDSGLGSSYECLYEKSYFKSLIKSKKFIKKLDSGFKKIKNLYYVPHKRSSFKNLKTKAYIVEQKIENFIAKNDIIIFDVVASTFMYFCIINRIKFYIITEKNVNDISGISLDYKKFLLKLEKKGILFQQNKIKNLVKKLSNN